MMLYSRVSSGKSTAKDKKLRQRYMPWSGTNMKGAIEFVHNKNLYRVQKEFSSDSPNKDKVMFRNLSSGEDIILGKKEEIGEYLFGIDVKSFERSSYIGSLGKVDFEAEKNSKDSLADKIISNLSDTGEENFSKSVVIKRLEEALKDLKWSKGNGGAIHNQKLIINDISQKIYDCKVIEDNNQKFKDELLNVKSLRNEKKDLNLQIENIKKTQKLNKIDNIINLIEKKHFYVEKLGIPQEKIYNYIESLSSQYQIVKSDSSKVKELEKVLDSIDKNTSYISEKEMSLLNQEIKDKKIAEASLKKSNDILKEIILNPEKYFLNNDNAAKEVLKPECYSKLINDFKNCEQTSEELKSLKINQENTEKQAAEAKENIIIKKETTQKELDYFEKKKKINLSIQIFNVLILVALVICGIISGLYLPLIIYCIPFCVSVIFGVSERKNRIKSIEKLNENVEKSTEDYNESYDLKLKNIDSEIFKATQNLINLKDNSKDILEKAIKNFEEKIFKKEKNINAMLIDKKCKSVQDYYEVYAKTQSIEKIKKSYDLVLKDLKSSELKLIKNVSLYSKVSSIEDAVKTMKGIVELGANIKELEETIKFELGSIGLNNADVKFLKNHAEELRKNYKNIECEPEKLRKMEERAELLKNLNLEENYLEIQKNIKTPDENIENLEKRLHDFKAELSNMEQYFDSLKIAYKTMEEASDELRRDFNPQLDARASEIFEALTSGAYNKIHIGKDYNIMVNKDEYAHKCEDFSSGTIDQAYLALRIAISEFISKNNNVPLILDDAFIQYDDKRLDKVMNFFKDYSRAQEERQVIIFTCHKNVADLAKEKGATVIS